MSLKKKDNNLDSLNTRINKFKNRNKLTTNNVKTNSFSKAFKVLADILGGILVCGFLGYLIDYFSNTKFFFILFGFLGIFVGILNTIRDLKKEEEEDKK